MSLSIDCRNLFTLMITRNKHQAIPTHKKIEKILLKQSPLRYWVKLINFLNGRDILMGYILTHSLCVSKEILIKF